MQEQQEQEQQHHSPKEKSVLNPKKFQSEALDKREKNLFKSNFSPNGLFEFKYKKKYHNTGFHVKSSKEPVDGTGKLSSRTEMRMEMSKIADSNTEVSLDLNLEKTPKVDLHVSYRPVWHNVSFGASINGEYNKLKDTKVTAAYQGSYAKLKFQVARSWTKKHSSAPWSSQITCVNGITHPKLTEYGIQITNEETLTNLKSFEGLSIIKGGSSKQGNYGLLASHRFSRNHLPSFQNFVLFYSTRDSLLSLKMKDIRKPASNFTAVFVNNLTKDIEVGAMLNRDAHKDTTNLQLGMRVSSKKDEFKFKVKENLEGAIAYTCNASKYVKFSISHRFALASGNPFFSNESLVLPVGIKIEAKD